MRENYVGNIFTETPTEGTNVGLFRQDSSAVDVAMQRLVEEGEEFLQYHN